MVSIPKIVGIISCGCVLCLSLFNATQATAMGRPDPCANRKGGLPNLLPCSSEKQQGIQTIRGEVLRIDGKDLFIERFNGQEMWLHLEPTTKVTGVIDRGDRIEAKISEEDYLDRVLSIREIQ